MTTAYQSILRPPSPNGGAEESFDFTGVSSRLSPTRQLSSPTASSSGTHNRHFIIDSAKSPISSSSSSSSSISSSSSATAARTAAASTASQSDVPKSMKYTPSYQHYHSRNFSLSNNNLHSSKRSGKTIATPPQSPDLSADAKRRSRSFASPTVSMSSGGTSTASRSGSSTTASAIRPSSSNSASASPPTSSNFDLSVDFPYLRATHSFNAQALFQEHNLDESSSVCLSFDESDIAILHSVHTSGWGDATLLSSGIRGWIPTNYFVPYVESQAVPLLAAILTFVINPRSHEVKNQDSAPTTAVHTDIQKTPAASSAVVKNVNYTFSQTSITNIVAGVRSLLEMCGTLTRDSPIVRRSPSIRKFRKGLLTELAILVSLAKQHKNTTDGIIIEKLLQGCYKIVTKTVIFLDVWAIETDAKSKLDDDEPPSPSKQLHDSVLEHQRITELREHKLQHAASSESVGSPQKRRPNGSGRSKASQRESVIFHTEPPFASQRLDEVHEALTTYLGIFIHRMSILETDPTASSQILLNTRKSMLASRELLASVEAISTASRPRSRELEKSKDNLYAQIRSLVHIAREVASASLEDFENANEPSSKRHDGYEKLVNIAVDCARSAGECVVRCRNMLQQMGDFQLRDNREYPDFSDGLIAVDDRPSRSSSGSSSTYCENEEDNCDDGDDGNGNSTVGPENDDHVSDVTSSPATRAAAAQNSLPRFDSEGSHKQVKSSPSRVFDTLKDYNAANEAPKSPPTPSRVYDEEVNGLLPRIPHLSPLRTDKDSPTDTNSDVGGDMGESRIEEVVYDNNNNLRGATVRALVSMLVDEKKTAGVSMTSSFFLTFRTFTNAEEVYEILVQRFEPERQLSDVPVAEFENFSARRLKIFNFITRWMESHWRQSSDGVIMTRLLEFADSHFASVASNGDKIIHAYARDIMSGELNDGEPIIRRPIELENEADFYSQRKQGNQAVGKKVGSTISISLSKTQLHQLQKYHEMATRDNKNDEVVEEASRSLMNVSTWASSIRKGSHNASSLSANNSSVHLPGVDGQQASQQASNLLSILDFDAMDIAHQLTQIDSELFKAIEPNELINQNFALKKRGLGLAPHVAELSAYSNQLSSFVGDSILGGVESGSGINTKTRTKLLKQWIKIADRCHELGNFNTTLSIVSAMQSVNILRLKKIWETLSAKYHTMFQNLKYVLDPNKNFSGYRNKLKSQPLPVIPYLGLYLSDLTFVEEGNPKFRRPSANASEDQPKIINVDRCERTTRLVGELQRYQQVSYNLIPSKELQFWLRSEMAKSHALVVRDQQGLWRRSCIVEPKA